jgi:hypothetical protein
MNAFTPFTGSRTGKIARLPRTVRDELNLRLDDGVSGRHIVAWLNALPEVRAMLEREFAGRPVNEQNISAWKRGGFQNWLRMEAVGGWVRSLAEEGLSLREEAGGENLEKTVTTLTVIAMGRMMHEAMRETDLAKKSRVVLGVAREVARLRQMEVAESRQHLERERLEWSIRKEAGDAQPSPLPAGEAPVAPASQPGMAQAKFSGREGVEGEAEEPTQTVHNEADQAGTSQVKVTAFRQPVEAMPPPARWEKTVDEIPAQARAA